MNPKEGYLSCAVSPGMFSSEVIVEFALFSGSLASLFVDKSLVRINGEGNTGHLKVDISRKDDKATTVLLPSEALETGSRWATVPNLSISA